MILGSKGQLNRWEQFAQEWFALAVELCFNSVKGASRERGGGGYCFITCNRGSFLCSSNVMLWAFQTLFFLKISSLISCQFPQELHLPLLPLYTSPKSSPSKEATGVSCEVLRAPAPSSSDARALPCQSPTCVKEPGQFQGCALKWEARGSKGWKSLSVEWKSRHGPSPLPSPATDHQRDILDHNSSFWTVLWTRKKSLRRK